MSDIDETEAAIKRAAHAQWRTDNSEARRAYELAYYHKNKEKRAADRKRYYDNLSPEAKALQVARQKQWVEENREARKEHQRRYRERNKEKIARANREYTANPGVGQYIRARRAATLEVLAGRPRPEVCDICSGPPDEGRSLHYDHCHQSGIFRGWICRECNLMLGNARDNPDRLRAGAAYLEGTSTNKT